MEPRIRERFTRDILEQTAERYGVDADSLRELGGFESYIYEFERDGHPLILRIGHSLRRSVGLIQGEADWINYLARGGASVARAVRSENDVLVESVDDGEGGCFLATAFVRARGRPPTHDDFTPALIERYGQEIGRMHRLTKEYEPPNVAWRRPSWDDEVMQHMADFLPATERIALRKLDETVDALRLLPRDRDSYGLVHQDAHGSNFFVDDAGALTFFDFDDCAYTWFVGDVAIVLFYAVVGRDEPSAIASDFLSHFLRGYRRENWFDPQWFAHVPTFLKLRELELYAVIHRSSDVDNLTHPWDIRYMAGRKTRIENDVPLLELDFTTLDWE